FFDDLSVIVHFSQQTTAFGLFFQGFGGLATNDLFINIGAQGDGTASHIGNSDPFGVNGPPTPAPDGTTGGVSGTDPSQAVSTNSRFYFVGIITNSPFTDAEFGSL